MSIMEEGLGDDRGEIHHHPQVAGKPYEGQTFHTKKLYTNIGNTYIIRYVHIHAARSGRF